MLTTKEIKLIKSYLASSMSITEELCLWRQLRDLGFTVRVETYPPMLRITKGSETYHVGVRYATRKANGTYKVLGYDWKHIKQVESSVPTEQLESNVRG